MEWNGRKIRPAGNVIKAKEFDFQDALKPLGEKRNNGFVWVLGGQFGSVRQTSSTPVTPTPTPSVTPTSTLTPTPSVTPTQTNTPSVTPTLTNTPTNTGTPTQTPTTSVTPTNTLTPTPTVTPSRPASGTTEANTYLAAVTSNGGTGLTSTISAATVTLFTSLVSNGLYSKMVAMYPLLGGVANSSKLNAVNLGTYDITWNGGMSFTVTGATSNGTNGYGDTGFIYSGSNLSYFTNGSFGVYCNTAFDSNTRCPMGSGPYGFFGGTGRVMIYGANNGFNMDYGVSNDYGRVSVTSTPKGLYLCSSTGTSLNRVLVNGSTAYSTTPVTKPVNGVSGSMLLFKRDDGFYYNGTESFAFISSVLTPSEQTTLSTIINTYQTSLGRNEY
jgi:hypothetical protein